MVYVWAFFFLKKKTSVGIGGLLDADVADSG
jgi:hypothetical protein